MAVLSVAGLGVLLVQLSNPGGRDVTRTECGLKLVLLHEVDLSARPLQVMADLRGIGDDAPRLPLTDGVAMSGGQVGHQSFRPKAGVLTLAFGLPPSASMTAEIHDEQGAVLRQIQLSPLVECEWPK